MSTRADLQQEISDALTAFGITMHSIQYGLPEPEPEDPPYAIVKFYEPTYERWTMGNSGTIAETYDTKVWFVLGNVDMTPQEAEAARLRYADEARAAFALFAPVGLFTVDLTDSTDNIDTYRDEGARPQLAYNLRVTELRAANAAAS